MGEQKNVQDRKNQRQMPQSEHERQDSDFENDDHVVGVAHQSLEAALDKRNTGDGNNARRPEPAQCQYDPDAHALQRQNTPRNTGSMGLAGSAKTQIATSHAE